VIRIAGRGAAAYTTRLVIPRTLAGGAAPGLDTQGTAPAGTTVHYLLEAEGETAGRIELATTEGQAGLTISGFDDGQPLLTPQDNATAWEGRFPTTQRYLIEITATEGDIAYTLTTEVTGNPSP